jgi:hypothetical protein
VKPAERTGRVVRGAAAEPLTPAPPLEETRSVVKPPSEPPSAAGVAAAAGQPESSRRIILGLAALVTATLVGLIATLALGNDRSLKLAPLAIPSVGAAAGAPTSFTPPTAGTSAPEPTAEASAAPTDPTASSAASAPPVRPPSARCNPPYYYEDGFKRFKPGCL